MKRLALLILLTVVAMMAFAPLQVDETAVSRFATVEVWVDSGDRPLAAWQVEVIAVAGSHGNVQIVGVESGGATGYAEPPYYDSAALMQGRIIVASFSMAKELPKGSTRVAVLHVRIEGAGGNGEPEFASSLMAAATVDGVEIAGTVKIQRGEVK
jgi:hypothetical protein